MPQSPFFAGDSKSDQWPLFHAFHGDGGGADNGSSDENSAGGIETRKRHSQSNSSCEKDGAGVADNESSVYQSLVVSSEQDREDQGSEYRDDEGNDPREADDADRPWDGSRSVDSHRMGGSLASSASHHAESAAHFALAGAMRATGSGSTDDNRSLAASLSEQSFFDDDRRRDSP
eukprot:CAMPEP_0172166358 /NCGR_PEP_ID=MMETSP1050-20130122/8935_1 /TAXON_ID=233186 /ORGANISM="Cryptomonas curvata, Strain CCAP979/52" /LENGTH=174 /DNA_ID=CAMNT_0012836955 /DNA_START=54 /DNA_END=575 /DNA_ORIENTATION=+